MIEAAIPVRVAFRAATRCRRDQTGCLISAYSTGSHGYAQIGWHGLDGIRRATTAHRAAWSLANGQIAPGMTVDHTCKTRRCVRLDHLRLMTNFENARRTSGRDWPVGSCINGHSNRHLHTQPNGRTRCRLCNRVYQQDYRRRKAAAT